MLCPSRLIRSPRTWALATSQPPEIIRAATRASRAQAIDPNSWASLRKLASFYHAIKLHDIGDLHDAMADIAKRRNRILRNVAGDSSPRFLSKSKQKDPAMPTEWSIDGRTYVCIVPKNSKPATHLAAGAPTTPTTSLIIFEQPYDPRTLGETHSMYVNNFGNTNTVLFLRGPSPNWPSAKLVRPATPKVPTT